MFRFFVRLFALVGLIVVLLAAGGGYYAWKTWEHEEPLPDSIVLDLNLDQSLEEHGTDSRLSDALFSRGDSLRDMVDALDRGRLDPRVKGVVARLGGDQVGTGKSQELRAAIQRFRSSGRFAFAFSESFGELGPGDRSYYIASAFDRIWLQPVGLVGLTGLSASVPFGRGALDEIGVGRHSPPRGIQELHEHLHRARLHRAASGDDGSPRRRPSGTAHLRHFARPRHGAGGAPPVDRPGARSWTGKRWTPS